MIWPYVDTYSDEDVPVKRTMCLLRRDEHDPWTAVCTRSIGHEPPHRANAVSGNKAEEWE